MRGLLPRWFCFTLSACLAITLLRAQTPQAHLEVRTETGATIFHMGERIPLQLIYTALPDAHLYLNSATYDRSGRMPYESFTADPGTTTADPLQTFFSSAMGIAGGGLSSGPQELSTKPSIIALNLNEWVRFDQPGDYTVTVQSRRISMPGRPYTQEDPSVGASPLALKIIPATPAWQQATLSRALQALTEPPRPHAIPSPAHVAAIADIRYLVTPAAIDTMVANLGDDQQDRNASFALGLIGLPPALHDLAIRKLQQALSDPKVTVSSWQLTALSVLQASTSASASSSTDQQRQLRQRAWDAALHLALAVLPLKTGTAQAQTANFLSSQNPQSFSPTEQATLAGVLATHFDRLTPEQQTNLLNYNWDSIATALTTAQLQQAASLPIADAADSEMSNYNRDGLKSAALYRWYQRDPQAAKQLILDQLRSNKPAFTADALWFLPNDPMPEQEAFWAQALFAPASDANPLLLIPLMDRFGTGAYAAQMGSALRSTYSPISCKPYFDTLAYLVRFNSSAARSFLSEAVQHASPGCMLYPFTSIAAFATNDTLTTVALEALTSENTPIATDAARYLTEFGDTEAKQPLLTRYRAWSAQWNGKADTLDTSSLATGPERYQDIALGQALAQALLANQGWMPDAPLRAEVLKLCVGQQVCQTAQGLATDPPSLIPVHLTTYAEGFYLNVGPFQLHSMSKLSAKLRQYPQSTTFALAPLASTSDARQLASQIEAAFHQAGLTLTSDTPPPQN